MHSKLLFFGVTTHKSSYKLSFHRWPLQTRKAKKILFALPVIFWETHTLPTWKLCFLLMLLMSSLFSNFCYNNKFLGRMKQKCCLLFFFLPLLLCLFPSWLKADFATYPSCLTSLLCCLCLAHVRWWKTFSSSVSGAASAAVAGYARLSLSANIVNSTGTFQTFIPQETSHLLLQEIRTRVEGERKRKSKHLGRYRITVLKDKLSGP